MSDLIVERPLPLLLFAGAYVGLGTVNRVVHVRSSGHESRFDSDFTPLRPSTYHLRSDPAAYHPIRALYGGQDSVQFDSDSTPLRPVSISLDQALHHHELPTADLRKHALPRVRPHRVFRPPRARTANQADAMPVSFTAMTMEKRSRSGQNQIRW